MRIAFVLCVIGLCISACGHSPNAKIEFECPDGSVVYFTPSKSENNYTAYAANQSRGISECGKALLNQKGHNFVDRITKE